MMCHSKLHFIYLFIYFIHSFTYLCRSKDRLLCWHSVYKLFANQTFIFNELDPQSVCIIACWVLCVFLNNDGLYMTYRYSLYETWSLQWHFKSAFRLKRTGSKSERFPKTSFFTYHSIRLVFQFRDGKPTGLNCLVDVWRKRRNFTEWSETLKGLLLCMAVNRDVAEGQHRALFRGCMTVFLASCISLCTCLLYSVLLRQLPVILKHN
jgi:hypothetical protein